MALLLEESMAKEKNRRSDSTAGDSGTDAQVGSRKVTTKLPAELMRKARTVAAFRDVDLYDYLVSVLEPSVNSDFADITSR